MAHIQTTHTGSLPRPADLAELIVDFDRGEPVDDAEFQRVITDATRAVVRQQVDTGIDIVSDGEYSKVSYVTYVKERLTGFNGPPRNPMAAGQTARNSQTSSAAAPPPFSSPPTTDPSNCATPKPSAATSPSSKPPRPTPGRKVRS